MAEINPFAVSSQNALEKGVFSEFATLRRRTFLYREIDFRSPFEGMFVYNGWWFRQIITINGHPCWFQISWLTIAAKFEFDLPTEVALEDNWTFLHGDQRNLRGEIQFTRGLMIRRFRLWLCETVIYDEIV